MQGKAGFFGSQTDKSNMIIVFSIALFFYVSSIQAEPGKPKVKTEEPKCCPTKLCYKVNLIPDEKMEFIITQTTCTCGPEVGDNCMNTFKDIEYAISKLHRAYDFGRSTNQVPPAPVDVTTQVQQCCPTKLCTNIAYQPHGAGLDLIVALIPTTCTCSLQPGISCLDSFELIEQACSTFVGAKYIMGFE